MLFALTVQVLQHIKCTYGISTFFQLQVNQPKKKAGEKHCNYWKMEEQNIFGILRCNPYVSKAF